MFDKMEIDDDEAAAVVAASIDELELYLREPRVKGITDVLRWWALNAGKYPILSRVALDKLACPRPFSYFSFSRGMYLTFLIQPHPSMSSVNSAAAAFLFQAFVIVSRRRAFAR
jgi:hypothetical protein